MFRRYSSHRQLLMLLSGMLLLAGCANAPQPMSDVKPVVTVEPVFQQRFDQAIEQIKNRHFDRAMQSLTQLAEEHNDFPGIHINLALLYLQTQKYPLSLEHMQKAQALDNNNPVIANHLGIILRHMGRFNEAEQAYLQAITLDNNYAQAHLNIGILYDLYLQDLSKALQHYSQYQQLSKQADEQVAKWIFDLKNRQSASGG